MSKLCCTPLGFTTSSRCVIALSLDPITVSLLTQKHEESCFFSFQVFSLTYATYATNWSISLQGLIAGFPYQRYTMEDEALCNVTLSRLNQFAAVIPYNRLAEGLQLLKRTLIIPPSVLAQQHKRNIADEVEQGAFQQRKTQSDPLRAVASANSTLRSLILKYNQCDQRLFELASKLFAEALR
eukprot:m.66738 g.66738  ORF g.66738 m.66738 type:complete len:183 (+) comp12137_c2_seq3:429-977(+)